MPRTDPAYWVERYGFTDEEAVEAVEAYKQAEENGFTVD